MLIRYDKTKMLKEIVGEIIFGINFSCVQNSVTLLCIQYDWRRNWAEVRVKLASFQILEKLMEQLRRTNCKLKLGQLIPPAKIQNNNLCPIEMKNHSKKIKKLRWKHEFNIKLPHVK